MRVPVILRMWLNLPSNSLHPFLNNKYRHVSHSKYKQVGLVKTYHDKEEHAFQNILRLLPCSNLQQHTGLHVGHAKLDNKCGLENYKPLHCYQI